MEIKNYIQFRLPLVIIGVLLIAHALLYVHTQYDMSVSLEAAVAFTFFRESVPRVTPTPGSFVYTFNESGALEETASMSRSSSPYFWLNSGGTLIVNANHIGQTVQGSLSDGARWQVAYAKSNPRDTEDGHRPQNLFRLITRSTSVNALQEVTFRIERVNATNTPNRGGWSGVFLMNRYKDGDNLYYAGIRMDGYAVIKKKLNGTYYTLAIRRVFEKSTTTSATRNLIPERTWLGLRSSVTDLENEGVSIDLWLKNGDTWEPILSARDVPGTFGTSTINGSGHGGIRTDFADVSFKEYQFTVLE